MCMSMYSTSSMYLRHSRRYFASISVLTSVSSRGIMVGLCSDALCLLSFALCMPAISGKCLVMLSSVQAGLGRPIGIYCAVMTSWVLVTYTMFKYLPYS